MLILDDLLARRDQIAASPDLTALLTRLQERATPVLDTMPTIPAVKALLSRDGGTCPDDDTPLAFDPWSPTSHRCPHCGKRFEGERHDAHWARAQHLWIAERAAHLATLHAITGDLRYATRARELLAGYFDLYHALPNRDNVLGPTHLFFSTYLESIWILNYLAAAFLLRECDQLSEDEAAQVSAIADESATLISEFGEGYSNRQVWHSAARTAIAAWFGDEELAVSAIEDRVGLLGQLGHGFGDDGMWHEGENYHLFALRGLMIGLTWAGLAGTDPRADSAVVEHLGAVLMAPSLSALPDLTFPARKDSRYGVSLAHPAYIESWEAGVAILGDAAPANLTAWLQALYATAPQEEETYHAYLHDAGLGPVPRSRSELSWWSLLTMTAELPPAVEAWRVDSGALAGQGLAVLRASDSYLAVECAGGGAGHGHPDRLHLTMHADGVHWLPDPGTGSYVTRDLFWYRSTMAHNAPLLDGVDQPAGDPARAVAFDTATEWQWIRSRWGELTRTVIAGPMWVLDLVSGDFNSSHQLDLPWHPAGDLTVMTSGNWGDKGEPSEFIDGIEEFAPDATPGAVHMRAVSGPSSLDFWFAGQQELIRAHGPGLPRHHSRRPFFLQRTTGSQVSFATVLDRRGTVTDVTFRDGAVVVHEGEAATAFRIEDAQATITAGQTRTVLGGPVAAPPSDARLLKDTPLQTRGSAIWIAAAPALDGTLTGFDRSAPLILDTENHYFRTETAYPGADELAARVFANWSDDQLFIAVDVRKRDVTLRAADAAPLDFDNEPDDINADGVQVYAHAPGEPLRSWLVRPLNGGTVTTRSLSAADDVAIGGAWQPTPRGYRMTFALALPGLEALRQRASLRFDIVVNEMYPERQRRAGQLIWSGGGGWAYLRGDRHATERLGSLELLG